MTIVISVGEQGPPGPAGSGGAGVFITDVQALGGLAGSKTWKPSVPNNATANLDTVTADTQTLRVFVAANGGMLAYAPTLTVNGVPVANLVETGTKRWFTGSADITMTTSGFITVTSSEGDTDVVTFTLAGAGPAVQSVVFGPYPGAQTELKAGDTIGVTVTTDADAATCVVLAGGAAASGTLTLSGPGTFTGTVTISGASGSQTLQVRAANSFGTQGAAFTSPALTLNQTYPSIGSFSVVYPIGQAALKGSETADVTATVTSFTTISYTAVNLSVPAPGTYAATKTVTRTGGGYVNSGTNYTISANRAANDATTTSSALVVIADTAPTAAISIVGNPPRLSSGSGFQDYTIRIGADQLLSATPTLNASAGVWQGAWVFSGGFWQRALRISDGTARGAETFSGLSLVGLAGVPGSTITSGASYTVGGFSTRTLTFAAFSQKAAINVAVGDITKTSAQYTGASVLTLRNSTAQFFQGYTITDSAGVYAPNGDYLFITDAVFAGSNTSGTLQVDISEAP